MQHDRLFIQAEHGFRRIVLSSIPPFTRPRMFVVSVRPGLENRQLDSLSCIGFRCRFFDADDHAAALKRGTYCDISREIRDRGDVTVDVVCRVGIRFSQILELSALYPRSGRDDHTKRHHDIRNHRGLLEPHRRRKFRTCRLPINFGRCLN